MASKNYRKGIELLTRIEPEAGKAFVDELRSISPDFTDYFVEFAWGDVYSRPGLDPKTKELISVAILSATGLSQEHLKIHILMALEVGCTEQQIIETIIQTTVYSGFISGVMALKIVKEVAQSRGASPPA